MGQRSHTRTRQWVAGVAIVGGGAGCRRTESDGRDRRRVAAHGVERTGPLRADFHDRAVTLAPSPDVTSNTGIASSTDTGSGTPTESLPDPTVGAPFDLPPLYAPSDAPPIAGATGPADIPPPNIIGAQSNPAPGDQNAVPEQDLGHGCRPLWCPHPPEAPSQPPTRPWTDPLWPDTSDSWESTTVLPSPCVLPPQPDTPPPPPLQYGSQTVSPAFDIGTRQWGFWYFGGWVPLFGSECQPPADSGTAEPHT